MGAGADCISGERRHSWRTEETYRGWLWRFVRWLGKRPLADVAGAEVRAFLSRLAVEERAGVATQKQALNALVFYFREVEGRDLGDFGDFVRARKRTRVPVVLNRAECERLFAALEGTPRLMAELMFGSGIRLTELLRLRVKDVDLERGQLIVRAGKGNEDRVTVLPAKVCRRSCGRIGSGCGGCTGRIEQRACRACGCPRGWSGSGRTPGERGNGSGSGRPARR